MKCAQILTTKTTPLRLAVVAVMLGLASTALGQSTSGPTYDVSKLDINGVRLNMTGSEAVAALKRRFGENVNLELDVHSCDPRVRPTDKCLRSITYNTPTSRLVVSLTTRLPVTDPRPDVVYSIEFSLVESDTVTITQEAKDKDELRKAALEKYGPPTYSIYGPCDLSCDWAETRNYSPYDDKLLQIYGGSLTLEDPAYERRVRRFIDDATVGRKPAL